MNFSSGFVLILIVVTCTTAAPTISSAQTKSSGILDQASGIINAAVDLKANILTPPVKSRESAKIESEGLPSRILSVYDDKQKTVADFINPKPIIDTISEEDKYGNNGDHFIGVGRAIVNGYESFANFVNKLLDTPTDIAKNISRGLTQQLDVIGGKLVGLA